MVHSICDSYPKFGAAAPRQTGVITRRKKWGRLTPPPPSKLRIKGEISVGMRGPTRPDPTRPDPITLLRSLYLWNGLTDSRAVFFVRCHHSINFVFDRYRYPPVPATARDTCRGEGVEDTLSLGNSTTAGPIAFKFGV